MLYQKEIRDRMKCKTAQCCNERKYYCQKHERMICESCDFHIHYNCKPQDEEGKSDSKDATTVFEVPSRQNLQDKILGIHQVLYIFNTHKKNKSMEEVENFEEGLESFVTEWNEIEERINTILAEDEYLQYYSSNIKIEKFWNELKNSELYNAFAKNLLDKLIQRGCTEHTEIFMKSHRAQLDKEYGELREKLIIKFGTKMRITQQEMERAKLEITSNVKEIQKLQNTITKLTNDLNISEQARLELEKIRTDYEKVKKELGQVKPECEKLKLEFAKIKPEFDKIKPELEKLKPELENTKKQVGTLQNEKKKLTEDLAKITNAVKAEEAKVAVEKKSKDANEKKLQSVQASLNKEIADKEALKKDLNRFAEEHKSLTENLAKAAEEKKAIEDNLNKEVAAKAKEIQAKAKVAKDLKNAGAKIAQHVKEITTLKAAVDKLTAEKADLQKKIPAGK
ncbi:unnamed protein product [Moneuplotes crassus]|uniref:Uncharacterized protein n=1 Tax=Euplotes crassus TaxID=5936 RepID=A0AAD2D911_EUPCR|nr:unnamed protein product [Moneuplotes crassus]